MLRFRGSPALSPFRLENLLAALRRRVPTVTEAYAEFAHFVDGSLTTHDREVIALYAPAEGRVVTLDRPELYTEVVGLGATEVRP